MEKIGYIYKSNLLLAYGLNSIDRLKNVEIKYGYRDVVEERNDVIQPICSGVIITKDNKILIVNKNKKSIGVKSPEKNKTLLHVGGHLDISDRSNSNFQTFVKGMKREMAEELGLKVKDVEINKPILTYTPVSEKSAKHIGIIFPIIIQNAFDITFVDGHCKFVDIDSLHKITNFESWSEIILNKIVRKTYKTEMHQ